MTDGRLEVESKSQECLVIIKREVTSNNLPKRRVLSSTHGVVGGRRLATASYPIIAFAKERSCRSGFDISVISSVAVCAWCPSGGVVDCYQYYISVRRDTAFSAVLSECRKTEN